MATQYHFYAFVSPVCQFGFKRLFHYVFSEIVGQVVTMFELNRINIFQQYLLSIIKQVLLSKIYNVISKSQIK